MKKQPKNKVLFLIPVGVILAGAVIFLCTRGNENDSVCKENVARLQALENSDISQTEEQPKKASGSETDNRHFFRF